MEVSRHVAEGYFASAESAVENRDRCHKEFSFTVEHKKSNCYVKLLIRTVYSPTAWISQDMKDLDIKEPHSYHCLIDSIPAFADIPTRTTSWARRRTFQRVLARDLLNS